MIRARPAALPRVMGASRKPAQPLWSSSRAMPSWPASTSTMNSRAPMRGPAKAAVAMKKAPSRPPLQCHQDRPLNAARPDTSRWARTMISSARVPTRKDTRAAAMTLDRCLASWPLMPACSGITAPASRGRASSHQLGMTVSGKVGASLCALLSRWSALQAHDQLQQGHPPFSTLALHQPARLVAEAGVEQQAGRVVAEAGDAQLAGGEVAHGLPFHHPGQVAGHAAAAGPGGDHQVAEGAVVAGHALVEVGEAG